MVEWRGFTADPGEDPELDADPHAHGAARNDFYFWRKVGISGTRARTDDRRSLILVQRVLEARVIARLRCSPV